MDNNIHSARFLAKTIMMKSAVRSRSSKLHGNDSASSTTKKKTTGSSSGFLDSLNKSSKIKLYEKIEKSTANLKTNIEKMFELAKKTETEDEDKDKATMISYIEDFVSDYNTVYSSLNAAGGVLDKLFRDQLGKITGSYAEELEKLGITVSKNGELSIDKDVLKEADYADIKAVFGAENRYMSEIDGKLELIYKSAASSLQSLDTLYGSSTYDKNGKYSFYDEYDKYGQNSLKNWWDF